MKIRNHVVNFLVVMEICLISYSQTAPQSIESEFENIILDAPKVLQIDPWKDDKYYFKYETNSGNEREESGSLKKTPEGDDVLVVKGFYSYVGADNEIHRVEYIADEKGFRPTFSKSEPKFKTVGENGVGNRILPPGLIASLTG